MKSMLAELFGQYFELVMADTPARLDAVFRLRHQVYCLETGFEDKNQFPDGRERDHFDALASHALIQRRESDITVATVRLVEADFSREGMPFPLEQSLPGLLTSRGYGPDRLPRERTAEISRFAISREFKRRAGESGTLVGVSDANADASAVDGRKNGRRRAEPVIILGLFRAIVSLSADKGYTHWVAAMERPLLRLLSRFGIHFLPVGAPIELHGKRQPCMGRINDVLARIHAERRDIWEFITDGGRLWALPDLDIGRVG